MFAVTRNNVQRGSWALFMAVAVGIIVACDLTEPEEETSVGYVRVCWSPEGVQSRPRDCVADGHWGNERVSPRNGAVPLSGIPVRICRFSHFTECHSRTDGYFRLGTTDANGYIVFPSLPLDTYLFLPDIEEVGFGGCELIPVNEYGGAIVIRGRVVTTPVEYQNSHIGELWFETRSCE